MYIYIHIYRSLCFSLAIEFSFMWFCRFLPQHSAGILLLCRNSYCRQWWFRVFIRASLFIYRAKHWIGLFLQCVSRCLIFVAPVVALAIHCCSAKNVSAFLWVAYRLLSLGILSVLEKAEKMHITMDPGHQRVTTSAAQNLTAHFPGDGRLDFLEDFPFEIPVTIVELIMAVIILLGNGLVIAAYISDRKLRTVTNFFLVNLVIADFIVGIALPISCSTYFIRVRSPAICILQFAVIGKLISNQTL